jgi:putative transferase (TIGR04331 family)
VTRPLLVTTALEHTWGESETILYAGEWCRLYERRQVWGMREHEVLPYHWSERHKLERDHRYLNDLQETLLVRLTDALNSYHQIERPQRYWRMVLGVWLPTYVATLFDRWECLRLAFARGQALDTIALPEPTASKPPPRDGNAFIDAAAYDAEWNHRLYLDVIRFQHAQNCTIRAAERLPPASAVAAIGSPTLAATLGHATKRALRTLVWKLDALAGHLFRSHEVTFVNSYFPLRALIKLNLALGQFPRLHLKDFHYEPEELGPGSLALSKRQSALQLSGSGGSEFEAFLIGRLQRDIPCVYLESFRPLLERAREIRISTKVICSAGSHWSNELFKFWSAEEILKGARFVALTHGGAIPVSIDQTMCFEEKVSDRKVTWTIPFMPNHVRLPPNKLVDKRINSSKTYCSVITQETPLFPYRASDGPIAVGVLEVVPLVRDLFTGLRREIQQCLRVKPYRNLGWNTRQRFSDAIGADKLFTDQTYDQCLQQSRIIVCTYPETTFAEAMASGLPTLLVYSAHQWGTIPQMQELLGTLRSADIVHEDAGAAAGHVNRIWDDPERWWRSPTVVSARERFFALCLDLDQHWLKRWKVFLRESAAGAAPAGMRSR